MKKLFLFFSALIVCLSVYGATEFKIGNAKYLVLPDGGVELKEYKKAAGDIELTPKVTDPKSKQEYSLTSIGEKAFKGTDIASITVPYSVATIGNDAFLDCKSLVTVKLPKTLKLGTQVFKNCESLTTINFPDIIREIPACTFLGCKSLKTFNFANKTKIGTSAFCRTGLSEIVIPASVTAIDSRAFGDCSNLVDVTIETGSKPVAIGSGAFYGSPVENVAILRSIKYSDEGLIFDKFKLYNNNKALKTLLIGREVDMEYPNNVFVDCPDATLIFEDENAGSQAVKVLEGMSSDDLRRAPVYFGITSTEGGITTIKDKPMNGNTALIVANGNIRLENFLKKLEKFTRVAVEEPENLKYVYQEIDPKEGVEFNSYLLNTIRVLCDSVYFAKPTLTPDEIDNVYGFINNYLMGIGADYGIENCMIDKWATNDVLTRDIENGDHKDDYERILKAVERLYKLEKKAGNNMDYLYALQMGALCGLERWKDAANQFPKFCNEYFQNGKLTKTFPYEITYMREKMSEHGCKTVVPNYQKNKKVASDDSGSAFEFFMDAAINLGIERYKEKKAEKKARELYYDALGLDKKGRPKKK